jgi:FixJ family two-component response regulator
MADDILIVDDEADIRDLLSEILQDEGFTTRSARDSEDALSHVANRQPNLIFLDIWLQGSRLDAFQLLDVIKAQHPELPIVVISGHGNIESAVTAIQRGAFDFIEKPFKADRLVLVARRALETAQEKRKIRYEDMTDDDFSQKISEARERALAKKRKEEQRAVAEQEARAERASLRQTALEEWQNRLLSLINEVIDTANAGLQGSGTRLAVVERTAYGRASDTPPTSQFDWPIVEIFGVLEHDPIGSSSNAKRLVIAIQSDGMIRITPPGQFGSVVLPTEFKKKDVQGAVAHLVDTLI